MAMGRYRPVPDHALPVGDRVNPVFFLFILNSPCKAFMQVSANKAGIPGSSSSPLENATFPAGAR
jgi:hypothetical protein